MYGLLSVGVLTDQLDAVTHTVDSHVTGHSQRFKNVDFLIRHGVHALTCDLTQNRNLIVNHSHRDDGCLVEVHVGLYFLQNEGLGLRFCQSAKMHPTDTREINVSVVIHQI